MESTPVVASGGAQLGSSGDAAIGSSLTRKWTINRLKEQLIHLLLFLCALASVLTTLGIIWILLEETGLFFSEVPLTQFLFGTRWQPAVQLYGLLPLLWGTFLIAGVAAVIGLPTGLLAALYLSEYASPQHRAVLKPILEILAGIPSIVFGYFGLVFVTPYVLKPFFERVLGLDVNGLNALSAGVVVGIMIIPMVSSLSEDVLRSVPRGLREAGLALGATKFDVCVRIVLPAALSGIFASFLLALSRAVGETMAVTIAAGQKPTLTLNVLESVETMTAFIVNKLQGDAEVGTVEYHSLYAVAMALFVVTLGMNLLAQFVLRRYRNVYQ
jgi:phosphate transport system permease protein